jgi:Tol biopolymer transport system component
MRTAILRSVVLLAVLGAGASWQFPARAQGAPEAERLLQKAIQKEAVDGDLNAAIEQYKKIIALPGGNRTVAAQALIHLGQCYEKLGEAQVKEARAAYERVVRDFGDQAEAAKVARARLSALGAGGGASSARTEVAERRVYVGEPGEEPVSISPDGRYVVLCRDDIGGYWLRDLQTGVRHRVLTELPGAAAYKAEISPDGKQIAHTWQIKGNTFEIHVSALDGSSDKVLYRTTEKGRLIMVTAWMPDSRRILAQSYDIEERVSRHYIVSVSDGAMREIGQPEKADRAGRWGFPSPDGRYVAYDRTDDVFLYDTTTEQDSALIQNPASDSTVGWTPDGSGLVFMSDRSGSRDLYVVGLENGRPREDPRILKRDVRIYRLNGDGRLFRTEKTGGDDSYTVSVDEQSGKPTSAPSLLDPDSYPEVRWPGWSPDGKQLYYAVFKRSHPFTPVMLIRSPETGQKREVPPNPTLDFDAGPVLSPDGQRFAVGGMSPAWNFGVFAIASESGEVTQLVKIPKEERDQVNPSPNWSPDGKAIYYKMVAPGKGTEFIIKRKDLASGKETEVFRGFHTREMKISPDGTRLAYVRTDKLANSQVLGVLDLQSKKELELWRVPLTDSGAAGTTAGIGALPIKAPAWTPNGGYVLVARDLKFGTELWRFPAAGGPGEKLHAFPKSTSGFVLNPSGTHMAFTQRRTSFELWVLENFLPPLKVAK